MLDGIIDTLLMSESTQLFLKALGGIVTGLLVSTGHLDATNQDAFSQNINVFAGAIVTIISAFYLLEHAFASAKEELKWNYTPDTKTDASTTTTMTTEPTVETPAQPTA